MNKFFLAAIFLFFNSFCFSQIKAVTETGDEVILFEDGTWKYADTTKTEKEDISINPKKFTKNSTATFLLKVQKQASVFGSTVKNGYLIKGKIMKMPNMNCT